ncbi:MAG: hypothetical protein M4579_007502 [Chaenotheca gracillima]|nr:MAG: hypothetical protein M4579_007502 [Chaenotheca gracillima]
MVLDRGPWTSTLEYINALGTNETRWIESHAKPRMNFQRSMEEPESPDELLSLLERFLRLAPYLVPTTPEGVLTKTLSHPDLHLDNVFIDLGTRKISSVIDWQSTSVSEMFLQRRVPPMFLPENSGLDQAKSGSETQEFAKRMAPNTDLQDHYMALTKSSNSQRGATLNDKNISIRMKSVSLVCGAWEREDVFSFRHALIAVVANWKQILAESTPCPIEFSKLELELHREELELIEDLGNVMHQLQDANWIPLGGMVRPEHYEKARHANKRFKEIFISLAENEEQRVLHAKVWPYEES